MLSISLSHLSCRFGKAFTGEDALGWNQFRKSKYTIELIHTSV